MPSNERSLIPMILNIRIYCSIHRYALNPNIMRKITGSTKLAGQF
jgi:hypothetical protein